MSDCIFCKIVAGELPMYRVYEDADFLGFLDVRPLTLGNSLLIPKPHYRWVYDVPDFGHYFEVAKTIALASQDILDAESVSLLTLGYEVPHAHIRIIPRFPDDLHPKGIDTSINVHTPPEIMASLSQQLYTKINP